MALLGGGVSVNVQTTTEVSAMEGDQREVITTTHNRHRRDGRDAADMNQLVGGIGICILY